MSENLREMLQDIISESIKPIEKELQSLNGRVATIESNMATKLELEKLTSKIDSITHQVADNSEKIDTASQQVSSNSEKLDVITAEQKQIKQAVIDTKEDAISLKDGQERQDKILASLSMRSLEQETDIRNLQRIK